ncbi:MAG: M23 family metallopeptidase [candidate division KSB1 bacterium]|nr:M23 family metallopeptidase [candidate division KSB1 bacterium]MDZ7335235.1 M23 family metallopeptidase [candidate division KSB1 bacterium]MDZ7359092.1 M23 family metallopeptidase [candidate division KSB1 bacterium]MDZ7401410.1 M23 family metallopeptidase [candidate division KSB1 bacterium]
MKKIVNLLLLIPFLIFAIYAFWPAHRESHELVDLPDVSNFSLKAEAPIRIFDTVQRGETLSALLIKNGIAVELLQSIIEAFKEHYSLNRLRPGDRYEIEVDRQGRMLSLVYSPSVEKKFHIFLDRNNSYNSRTIAVDLVPKLKYLKANIQTTVYDAVLEAGETPELLMSYTDIFQWDIDFFVDPQYGDEIRIVYEKFYTPETEQFVKYGKILAAQYISKTDTFTAIYFANTPADEGYYDPKGNSFQKTFLKSPLNYRRISSHFSFSRKHPILKIFRPHYGVDYAAPEGTPVSAAANGVVLDKGYDRGIGNFVKLQHRNGHFVTVYGHLSGFAEGIQKGASVKQKQVIGFVGRTGLATGPHLHYAMYENGRPINPLKIKNASGEPILPENRERFYQHTDIMLAHLQSIDQSDVALVLIPASQVHFNRYILPER